MCLYMRSKLFEMPEKIDDGRLDFMIDLLDVIKAKRAASILFSFRKTKAIEASGYAILCCLSDTLREHTQRSSVVALSKNVEAKFIRKILTNEGERGFLKIEEMKMETSSFLFRGVAQGIDPSFPDA